jgi:hypothetical protein
MKAKQEKIKMKEIKDNEEIILPKPMNYIFIFFWGLYLWQFCETKLT